MREKQQGFEQSPPAKLLFICLADCHFQPAIFYSQAQPSQQAAEQARTQENAVAINYTDCIAQARFQLSFSFTHQFSVLLPTAPADGNETRYRA